MKESKKHGMKSFRAYAHARLCIALELSAAAAAVILLSSLVFGEPTISTAPSTVVGNTALVDAETNQIAGWVQDLRNPSPDVRKNSRTALVNAGARAVPFLLPVMSNRRFQEGVIILIGEMGPAGIDRLLVDIKNPDLRNYAGLSLDQLVTSRDHARATSFLDCMKDPENKNYCGVALVKAMGPAAVSEIPLLRRALKDKDFEIRAYAATALGQIGPKAGSSAPALVEALKDPQAQVRSCAAQSLGKLGRAAAIARPALQAALKDQSEHVRQVARDALKRIHD